MEEKKLDLNSIIGFVLIFAILAYMLWQNQPTPEELEAQEKAKQEQVEAEQKAKAQEETLVTTAADYAVGAGVDSLQAVQLQNKLGAFAYSALQSTKGETLVESDLFALKFSNKGGYLSEVRLKQFVDYDSLPIYLVKDNNASFNINFGTNDSRVRNTKDLPFVPQVTKNGDVTVVSMKLKVSLKVFLMKIDIRICIMIMKMENQIISGVEKMTLKMWLGWAISSIFSHLHYSQIRGLKM